MAKFFIPTAIAYVNGAPHLGHALEFIQADAIARYRRLAGDEVRFQTGTDEHGIKIVKTAAEKGVSIQQLVDENAAKFRACRELFDLSFDDFIRTSDQARHWPAVTKLWQKLVEKGDLYEQEYEGLYCPGCEEFKQEKDLEDGNCPIHRYPPEVVREKNWFFRLSNYSEQILQKLESREVAIVPEFRAKEIINVVREGLRDVSFSRPRDKMQGWGIPVPGDAEQLMYVWCDALANYISAVDYAGEGPDFAKWWPADLHVIGKDIVRFHAGVWLGMLLSADLPLPKAIFVHGFVTSEGQKMSKSLGNVVDPAAVAAEWGADALRWYLLSEIPTGQDGDFSAARFEEKYNSELANTIGNLVSRVLAMALKIRPDWRTDSLELEVKAAIKSAWDRYESHFNEFDIKRAAEAVLELAVFANSYIDRRAPWKLKENPAEQAAVLANLLAMIRQLGYLLMPLLPGTAGKILASLGTTPADFASPELQLSKPEILFPKKEKPAA